MEYLAIGGAFAGVLLEVFTAGKKSEKVDELKQTLNNVEEAHAIENKNSALSDSSVSAELRSDWGK